MCRGQAPRSQEAPTIPKRLLPTPACRSLPPRLFFFTLIRRSSRVVTWATQQQRRCDPSKQRWAWVRGPQPDHLRAAGLLPQQGWDKE